VQDETALEWLQANPATVRITVADDDTGNPVNLDGFDDIRMYVKATPETDDTDATVLALTSGDIAITSGPAGEATITAPADMARSAGLRWYRIDLLPGPITVACGDLRIKDT
jgi:hypothetical protein